MFFINISITNSEASSFISEGFCMTWSLYYFRQLMKDKDERKKDLIKTINLHKVTTNSKTTYQQYSTKPQLYIISCMIVLAF